jgi:hypothetical protein
MLVSDPAFHRIERRLTEKSKSRLMRISRHGE